MSNLEISENSETNVNEELEIFNLMIENVTKEECDDAIIQEKEQLSLSPTQKKSETFSIFRLCNPVWVTKKVTRGIYSVFTTSRKEATNNPSKEPASTEQAKSKSVDTEKKSPALSALTVKGEKAVKKKTTLTVKGGKSVPNKLQSQNNGIRLINTGKVQKPRKRRRIIMNLQTRGTQTGLINAQKRLNTRFKQLVGYKILKIANNLFQNPQSMNCGDISKPETSVVLLKPPPLPTPNSSLFLASCQHAGFHYTQEPSSSLRDIEIPFVAKPLFSDPLSLLNLHACGHATQQSPVQKPITSGHNKRRNLNRKLFRTNSTLFNIRSKNKKTG